MHCFRHNKILNNIKEGLKEEKPTMNSFVTCSINITLLNFGETT